MLASATEVVRGCGHGSSEGRSSSKKLELMRRVASRCSTVLTALAPVSPRKLSASPASSTTPTPLPRTWLCTAASSICIAAMAARAAAASSSAASTRTVICRYPEADSALSCADKADRAASAAAFSAAAACTWGRAALHSVGLVTARRCSGALQVRAAGCKAGLLRECVGV
jgi:hypothetical protein